MAFLECIPERTVGKDDAMTRSNGHSYGDRNVFKQILQRL
jgi:hypothetical protein